MECFYIVDISIEELLPNFSTPPKEVEKFFGKEKRKLKFKEGRKLGKSNIIKVFITKRKVA